MTAGIKTRLVLICACALATLFSSISFADAAGGKRICGGLFGENILPDGGMEQWQNGAPVGWKVDGRCSADEQDFARGRRSARLEAPGKEVSRLVSNPISVKPGLYLVRYVFKEDVPTAKEGSYARESFMTVESLDANGKALRSAYAFGSELPVTSWSYRQRIVAAPAGTTALRVNLLFVNHVGEDKPCSLLVDEVEVCPYYPPRADDIKVTATLAQELGRYTLSVDGGSDFRALEGGLAYAESSSPYAEVDPASTCGLVRRWPPYQKGTMFWNAAPLRGVSPGVYRISLRIRAGAKDDKDQARPILQIGVNYPHINSIGLGQFFASELKRDGSYHDYSVDFVKPDWGTVNIRLDTLQDAPEFWLDYVLLRPLCRFTDGDVQSLFPALFEARPAPAGFPRADKPRVLLLNGLCYEYLHLDDALKLAGWGDVKQIAYKTTYNEGPLLEGMPGSWPEMCEYDLLVVANANMQALGAEGRFMLREWVRHGGALVIMGGKVAFGASGLKGSFLDEALPVEISDEPFDIAPCSATLAPGPQQVIGGTARLSGVACPFIHDLKARSIAQTPLVAGDRPFLALCGYGKGRVACICAPPYGTAPQGRTPFWASNDWPALMRDVMIWTRGKQ